MCMFVPIEANLLNLLYCIPPLGSPAKVLLSPIGFTFDLWTHKGTHAGQPLVGPRTAIFMPSTHIVSNSLAHPQAYLQPWSCSTRCSLKIYILPRTPRRTRGSCAVLYSIGNNSVHKLVSTKSPIIPLHHALPALLQVRETTHVQA